MYLIHSFIDSSLSFITLHMLMRYFVGSVIANCPKSFDLCFIYHRFGRAINPIKLAILKDSLWIIKANSNHHCNYWLFGHIFPKKYFLISKNVALSHLLLEIFLPHQLRAAEWWNACPPPTWRPEVCAAQWSSGTQSTPNERRTRVFKVAKLKFWMFSSAEWHLSS